MNYLHVAKVQQILNQLELIKKKLKLIRQLHTCAKYKRKLLSIRCKREKAKKKKRNEIKLNKICEFIMTFQKQNTTKRKLS